MEIKFKSSDYGKYNKVADVIKSRTDDQIIKGFDIVRTLNGKYWSDLPQEVEDMMVHEQEEWLFSKYPVAKDVDVVADLYFNIAASRFPKAFHKFFWDFDGNVDASFLDYVIAAKKGEI